MWRGVVKGGWSPHDREIPLRIEVPRNRGRNSKKCCKQVGCTINKERETAAWATSTHALHELPACDDPEGQLEPFQSRP
jgi:hypothetical protein